MSIFSRVLERRECDPAEETRPGGSSHHRKFLQAFTRPVPRSSNCDIAPTTSGRMPGPSRAGCLLPPAGRASTAPRSPRFLRDTAQICSSRSFLGFFLASLSAASATRPSSARKMPSIRSEIAAAVRDSSRAPDRTRDAPDADWPQIATPLPAKDWWKRTDAAGRRCCRTSHYHRSPTPPRPGCTSDARSVPRWLPAD